MCPACEGEYRSPRDRRFHAQPNACPVCGPHVSLWDGRRSRVDAPDPVARAAELIREGFILAVKGLGGYHLAADATRPEAVERLRQRKRREEKPFAVMSFDLATIRSYAVPGPEEETLLASIAPPISRYSASMSSK
mgnify:CR=1 FL=1